MITCEEKFKKQKNGNAHHYLYYRCTKKINPSCAEKSIELKIFNKQIDAVLNGLDISERFQKWALAYLYEIRTHEVKAREQGLSAKQKEYERVTNQLDNLLLKYTSPENNDVAGTPKFRH
jgi:hypothetical protein